MGFRSAFVSRLAAQCGFMILLLLGPAQARASLGGDAGSVERDKASLAASRASVRQSAHYEVREFESAGARIREFVGQDGKVFAIAWSGKAHPDLDLLLGESFSAEYRQGQAAQVKRPGRAARRTIKTQNLVVEKSGHMRSLQGRAYLPSMIPEGVSLNEIK